SLASILFRAVRPQPLDDFDSVTVGVVDEEAVGAGNRRRLLRSYAVFAEVQARRLCVGYAQGEVPRAAAIRLRLEEQVQLLVAEFKPDDDEIESARFVDFLEAEQVAIKAPAAPDIRDDDGDMIDVRERGWLGHGCCFGHFIPMSVLPPFPLVISGLRRNSVNASTLLILPSS